MYTDRTLEPDPEPELSDAHAPTAETGNVTWTRWWPCRCPNAEELEGEEESEGEQGVPRTSKKISECMRYGREGV